MQVSNRNYRCTRHLAANSTILKTLNTNSSNHTRRKVVVTGIGAITPIGNTPVDFGRALMAGANGAGSITRFDATKFKTHFACEVKAFDALDYMEPQEMRKQDLFTQFAMAAAHQAIMQSMPDTRGIDLQRVGVIIGAANGGSATYEQQIKDFFTGDGTPRFHPQFIPMMMANAAPGSISIRYGLRGANYTIAAACASSNMALVEAIHKIRWGQADMMLAGGAEASTTEAAMGGFAAMRALSTDNNEAASASRPFDAKRNGFVLGEGAVLLMLEAEEHALRRGIPILAELAGGAITSDAFHIAAPRADGTGAAAAMRLALQDAGITPVDIDYLSAHATSTPVGDLCEVTAIRQIFGDNLQHLRISAPKAGFGHLLGAAGAIGVLAALGAIWQQQVPPTINTNTIDPQIPATLPIVTGTAQPHNIRTALCNSFGFGGHNATVICKAYEPL